MGVGWSVGVGVRWGLWAGGCWEACGKRQHLHDISNR